MILEKLKGPCPTCMATIDSLVRDIGTNGRAEMRAVYCDDHRVALTTVVRYGVLVWWEMHPCQSAAEMQQWLSETEAALTQKALAAMSRNVVN